MHSLSAWTINQMVNVTTLIKAKCNKLTIIKQFEKRYLIKRVYLLNIMLPWTVGYICVFEQITEDINSTRLAKMFCGSDAQLI